VVCCYTRAGLQGNPLAQTGAVDEAAGADAGASARGAEEANVDLGQLGVLG
jgi:hypothetical protein